MAGKFVIEKAKDGQFYFNLKTSNGQEILTCGMYTAKSGAQKGIESIQKNAVDVGNYERKEAKNGRSYFVLKAKDKQIIGQSRMYTSASSMEAGLESVKDNAPVS